MALITFAAGQRLTAAQLQTIVAQVDSLTAPGWISYGSWATLITASVTAPTQGASTAAGLYRRTAGSDLCHFQLRLDIGGGFSPGSGAYRFLLPFAAGSDELAAFHSTINEAGTSLRVGGTTFVDATHFEMWYDAAGSPVGSAGLSTPWTTSDWIRIAGAYRVAV